jgi:hypothetical protein
VPGPEVPDGRPGPTAGAAPPSSLLTVGSASSGCGTRGSSGSRISTSSAAAATGASSCGGMLPPSMPWDYPGRRPESGPPSKIGRPADALQVGVRETRMALGDHIVTGEDILTARKSRHPQSQRQGHRAAAGRPRHSPSPSAAARCRGSADGGALHLRHAPGPFLVSVTPTALATGLAAGVCAALAASGRRPREAQVEAVPDELIRQGARLGAKDTVAGPGTTSTGPVERDGHRDEEGGTPSVGAARASIISRSRSPAPGRTATTGTE